MPGAHQSHPDHYSHSREGPEVDSGHVHTKKTALGLGRVMWSSGDSTAVGLVHAALAPAFAVLR